MWRWFNLIYVAGALCTYYYTSHVNCYMPRGNEALQWWLDHRDERRGLCFHYDNSEYGKVPPVYAAANWPYFWVTKGHYRWRMERLRAQINAPTL